MDYNMWVAVVYVLLSGKLNFKSVFIYKDWVDITTPLLVADCSKKIL